MWLFGCTSTQVAHPTYLESIKANKKTIAILPAAVKLFGPVDPKKNVSREVIEDAQMKLSFIIQNEMYKWFQKNKYTLAVQDVRYSNEKLFSKGLTFQDYKKIPKDSIAKILGVDFVVFGITDLSKTSFKRIDVFLNFSSPLQAVASVGLSGLGLMNPNVTITDDIELYIKVVDAATNTKLFEKSYNDKVPSNGGLEEFYRNSIKNFAKTFPYKK